jgi:hypothetical protein
MNSFLRSLQHVLLGITLMAFLIGTNSAFGFFDLTAPCIEPGGTTCADQSLEYEPGEPDPENPPPEADCGQIANPCVPAPGALPGTTCDCTRATTQPWICGCHITP